MISSNLYNKYIREVRLKYSNNQFNPSSVSKDKFFVWFKYDYISKSMNKQ